jgi:hypothetical protein
MRSVRMGWVLAATAAVTGCGGGAVRDAYEGAARADSEVAVLFTPTPEAAADKKRRAFLAGIDGRTLDAGATATRVIPGTHLFNANCVDSGPAKIESSVLFQATVQAGHYYELGCASAVDRGTTLESVRRLLDPGVVDKLRR